MQKERRKLRVRQAPCQAFPPIAEWGWRVQTGKLRLREAVHWSPWDTVVCVVGEGKRMGDETAQTSWGQSTEGLVPRAEESDFVLQEPLRAWGQEPPTFEYIKQ